jgi:hypothetical protein
MVEKLEEELGVVVEVFLWLGGIFQVTRKGVFLVFRG